MDFITDLFDTSKWPPRWVCGEWSPAHGWLHILSDLGVWSAYFAIPLVLGSFLVRRRDLPFRAIFVLFAAFILLCGLTHLMEAALFWWPAYRLAGLLKLSTAIISWVTVFGLVRVTPEILAMRSPEALEREIEARREAEARLQAAKDELEKRAEDALRLQTAKVDRLVESNIIGVVFATPERVMEANDAFLAIVGRTREELEAGAIAWRAMTPPEQLDKDDAAIAELVERGVSTPLQKELLRPDGRRVPVLLGATMIDAAVPLWACFVQDMTHVKRVEDELREADRRKDEFLAILAHELRNPLAPIRNAAQVVRTFARDTPEVLWAGEVIERQVGQMARLLEDLLDISRITRGKLELRKSRVALASVVANAVETSRPLLDAHGHSFTVSLPEEPVHLEADPVRLAQILSNLLNNAAKYTENGGEVRLDATRVGGELHLSVTDTGVGFAPESLPRLFEMFSQAVPATQRSQGGLGIGLSLVKGLAEMHDGTVEAHSKGPGRGSEFIVKLPLDEVRAEPPTGQETDAMARVSGLRILVADDNRDAAGSLALILRGLGNEVRTAADGPEALRVADEFHPDVALLDIGMPHLDGHEVARRLRARPGGERVLLVAVTGWGQDEDRRRSRDAGFDLHTVKPVEAEALARLLAVHVRRP